MKKKGKKFVVESDSGFAISYGTVDQTTKKSAYIDISSWVEPLFGDDEDAGAYIRSMTKTVRNTLYNNLTDNFNKTIYIVDLDLRESGIHTGKKSFMSCNITLYSGESIYDLAEDLESLVQVLTEALNNKFSQSFIFNKKKKT